MNIVVNPKSNARLERYKHALPQALLLSGQSGVGLFAIANWLSDASGEIIRVTPALLTKTSTVPQISIGKVRELYEQSRTRATGGRVVIIDDADTMTVPAQNAFLKLLEEPNSSTKFILTSHRPEALLPTIKSRLETCFIAPISQEQTLTLIDNIPGLTAQKRAQLLFIAQGLPAELHRLQANEKAFREKASLIVTAKKLIEGAIFERIVTLNKEKLNRQMADILAEQLIQLLSRNPSPAGVKQIERLLTARERIAGGGNIKLQLLTAMV